MCVGLCEKVKIGQFCQVINEAKLGEKFPLARRMRVLLDASLPHAACSNVADF